MKKIVLELDLHDDKAKQKALKTVSSIPGIDSIAMDMKEQKFTVIGTVDPVTVVSKLRKFWQTDIFSVGPAKEQEKKEEPKREEAQKEEPKNTEGAKDEESKNQEGKEEKEEEEEDTEEEAKKKIDMQEQYCYQAYKAYYPHATTHYYVQGAEEDPNGCIIV